MPVPLSFTLQDAYALPNDFTFQKPIRIIQCNVFRIHTPNLSPLIKTLQGFSKACSALAWQLRWSVQAQLPPAGDHWPLTSFPSSSIRDSFKTAYLIEISVDLLTHEIPTPQQTFSFFGDDKFYLTHCTLHTESAFSGSCLSDPQSSLFSDIFLQQRGEVGAGHRSLPRKWGF